MLDIRLIRENPKEVRENLKRRKNPEILKYLDEVIAKDEEYRKILKTMEELRHKRNDVGLKIAELKKKKQNVDTLVKDMQKVGKDIDEYTKKVDELKDEIKLILMSIPNLLHESVPYGKDDSENVEVKKIGEKPKFNFEPKNHFDLLVNLGLIEQEKANKVSGHGFFYLKNQLAILDLALQRFGIDHLLKKGFTLIEPPLMLTRKAYEGVTDLKDFENVMYKIENEDLYMIATAEHPIASMFMDDVVNLDDLPLKFVGVSPCFRKEVGAHGKYTKGLFRMHQFNKVEQFVFCHPNESWKIHEELQKNTEEIFSALEIPFRVVNICTGDIGIIASKKYDVEGLMADGVYRELASNSNCTDYQARRLNIRFREKEGQAPSGFVHTLNNTAIATSRAMVLLLENHQRTDGSIKIPKALVPYTGFKEIVKK